MKKLIYIKDIRYGKELSLRMLLDDIGVMGGKRSPHAMRGAPVSYTHLDVYKRQLWRCKCTKIG